MTWKLNRLQEQKIIELMLEGGISGKDAREMTSAAIKLSKECRINIFLVDASKLEAAPDTFSLYDLPNTLYLHDDLERDSRIAVVVSRLPQVQKDLKFYETTCMNQGWNVNLFSDREQAILWLTGGVI